MDVNSFLVRESVQDEGINLILSVKNGDKCYHFPIIGKYEIQGTHDHLPFPSLQELVSYYMQSGLPAESSGGELIQLTLPCTSGIPEPVSSEMEHIYSTFTRIKGCQYYVELKNNYNIASYLILVCHPLGNLTIQDHIMKQLPVRNECDQQCS